jgi:HK97 family phage portal protein
MNILSWFRPRRDVEARSASYPLTPASLPDAMGLMYRDGWAPVTQHGAENLTVFAACVDAIAGTVAAQPVYAYRRDETGRTEASAHPIMRLAREGMNSRQSWFDGIEWWLAQAVSGGNGLLEIEFDGAGRVKSLHPVPWQSATPIMLRDGRLVFDVYELGSPYGLPHAGTMRKRRLLPGEYLHLRDRSDDGILGRSRLSRAAGAVSNALAAQDFAGSTWANQATPRGALEFESMLSQSQYDRLRESFDSAFAGTHRAGRTLILEKGAKWRTLSITAEDAQLLESRRFSVEEIARLMGVPSPVIGDNTHSTFTNSETLLRFFAQSTLTRWTRRIEMEFARVLFAGTPFSIEISLDGLLRGDPETRWKAHEIAVRNNILDTNEVREIEGWNPRPAQPASKPVEGPAVG